MYPYDDIIFGRRTHYWDRFFNTCPEEIEAASLRDVLPISQDDMLDIHCLLRDWHGSDIRELLPQEEGQNA